MAVRSFKAYWEAPLRFARELRRRKVIKVAGVYAIVGWLVIQIATQTFPALRLPDWATTLVVVLTMLGFPIALVLAWALELTPGGIRTEQAPQTAPGPTNRPKHSLGWLRRSGPSLSRRSRPTPDSDVAQDNPRPADPIQAKRAVVASLRHDLRTPMNAVLGYSTLLVMEAGELGIAPLVPAVQRLQTEARKLLAQIDTLLPSGPEAADIDVSTIRGHVHETLARPAETLVQQSEDLLAKAGSSERASADLERQVGAARKLLTVIRDLAVPSAPADATSSAGVERIFSRSRPRSEAETGPTSAGTLLVVDDNLINRDLLTRQLVHEGYSVFTAASGKEALEKLRLHDVDLVLLDVIMPEMDGIQVLEQMQRDPVLSEIPVVMISALDEIDAVARCMEKGALDYFAKPFDPVLLQARVSVTLQIHRLRQDLRRAEAELVQSRTSIDELLRSFVPRPLSDGFERGGRALSAHYPEVTAVVAQLEGLDAIASRSGANETIGRFNETLRVLEQCSSEKGFEIVRVTERSYTAIAGAPEWRDDHAQVAADYALAVRQALRENSRDGAERPEISLGLNTGALIAGVAGTDRLVCGMWGDAVTTADALAREARAGTIQVSAATCAKLDGRFEIGSPRVIEVPGHGHLRCYVLTGRKPSSAVL